MRMCEAFAAAGNEVILVYPIRKRGNEIGVSADDVWDFYGVDTRFSLMPIDMGAIGARHIFGLRSAKTALAERADAVYGRFLPAVAWTARVGIPSVVELHQPITGMTSNLYLSIVGYGDRLKGVVAITESLADYLRINGLHRVPHGALRVDPDGAVICRRENETARCEIRIRLGIPTGCFVAAYAGHLYAGRGIELIVELAALNRDVCFIIVGGEPEVVARYREQTLKRRLRNIQWIGFVPPKEVPDYLVASDVLLMPHQYKVEASGGGDIVRWMSPLKMFEYMAAGRPIIASDLPTLREILREDLAVLCEPSAVEQWSSALSAIRRNPSEYELMAGKAKREVLQYSWTERARRCLEMYR